MSRVWLVTGGSGTFGRAVVPHLLARPDTSKVRAFSRSESRQAELMASLPEEDRGRVRCILGDVRDAERVRRACRDATHILHAAALKRIERVQDDVREGVLTNVLGSMHVAEAAIEERCESAVLISSDKACLGHDARVELGDGTAAPINEMVRDKLPASVKTLSPYGIVERPITAWYKNALDGRRMYRVSYEPAGARGSRGAVVTEDHPVLTTTGWVRAAQLSSEHELITAEVAPNGRQAAVIIGCLLGDSSLSRHVRPSLVFAHSEPQWEWLATKRRAFAEFNPSPIKKSTPKVGRRKGSFRLQQSACFAKYRKAFYPDKKIVPRALVEEHFSPELLAAWYLDDGCLSGKHARLATHCFTVDDVEWLHRLFLRKGMGTSICHVMVGEYGPYPELRFTVQGSYRFFEAIGPFVPPALRYKIPKWCRAYDPQLWDLGSAVRFTAPAIVSLVPHYEPMDRSGIPLPQNNTGKKTCYRGHALEGDNVTLTTTGGRQCVACKTLVRRRKRGGYQRKSVYCLGVEGTQNFVVGGVIVHNCAPANSYGVTKLLAEHLFASTGRAWGAAETRLVSVRYGNVWASCGSVVATFRRAADEGQEITVTHPDATRFFWSPTQAVALAIWAAIEGRAGHTYVPVMRAARMGDLAEVTGCKVRRGQLHDAEKLHEQLVTDHEAMRSSVLQPDGLPFAVWEIPPVTGIKPQADPMGPSAHELARALGPRTSDKAERIPIGELALAFAGEDIWEKTC